MDAYEVEVGQNGDRSLKKPFKRDLSENGTRIEKLIRLKDPLGKSCWKGSWSNMDPIWNCETHKNIKEELLQDFSKDSFVMLYDDFTKYFSDFQVCHYHDSYKNSVYRYETRRNELQYFSFDIQTPGQYYFTVNQINKRFFPKKFRYQYSPLTQMIIRKDHENDNVEYIASKQSADKDSWFNAYCKVGTYYLILYTPWVSFVNEVTWSSYGPEDVALTCAHPSKLPHKLLQKAIISQINKLELKNFSKQGYSRIRYTYEKSDEGFGYFYFDNQSDATVADLSIELTRQDNIQLRHPFSRNGKRLEMTLEPSQQGVIWFLTSRCHSLVNYKMFSKFRNMSSSLKTLAKEKGRKFDREYNRASVGISQYIYYYADGVIYVYDNNSEDYLLNESVKFSLSNCEIEGTDNNLTEQIVKPGENKCINILKLPNCEIFSAKLEKCCFNVIKL